MVKRKRKLVSMTNKRQTQNGTFIKLLNSKFA